MEALQKAQPKDLYASEIDVRLGATWIDADYIQQFMEETFETPYYLASCRLATPRYRLLLHKPVKTKIYCLIRISS